ncbi:CPBP family intramembrane glutamic endopeptidase [Streptomyces sp. NPDC002851]
MTISPEFSTVSTAVIAALAAYFTFGEPWLGRRMYASLERRRDSEPRALVRYFRSALIMWWALAGLAVTAVLLSPGVSGADLGLRLPDESVYTYMVMALVLVATVAGGVHNRRLVEQDKHVPGRDAVAAMLPRTARERRLAAAVAVTDGVAAEFVYRGLFIAFGVGALGLDLYVAAALSLVIYALAGWYQGRAGVGMFALFGLGTTLLYVFTGSLLLPVVFHLSVTVRDLVFLPAPERMPERLGATS